MTFIEDFLSELKKQSSRGRCLHFDRGDRCTEIVDAHSIQQTGQLRFIQENGHVYRIVADLSVLKKSRGVPQPSKIGWNKVSTFSGLCQRHDNDLFEPIDNRPLIPNDEQISLYSYRCLCREYFVKENAARTLQELSKHDVIPEHLRGIMRASSLGQNMGFSRIQYHKDIFDRAIRRREFNEFEYICFASTSAWNMQLSGILSPDYDFLGHQIQNLGEFRSPLALITFFTAPLTKGWAYIFAWHRSSHQVCSHLMRTLATQVRSGHSIADALLRFSFSCCENHAFRISWWDGLSRAQQRTILERIELMFTPTTLVPALYLTKGLESIVKWEFYSVISTIRNDP